MSGKPNSQDESTDNNNGKVPVLIYSLPERGVLLGEGDLIQKKRFIKGQNVQCLYSATLINNRSGAVELVDKGTGNSLGEFHIAGKLPYTLEGIQHYQYHVVEDN